MKTEIRYMTEEESQAYYKVNEADNLRYISAKISVATPKQTSLIASVVRGMGIVGWSEEELLLQENERELLRIVRESPDPTATIAYLFCLIDEYLREHGQKKEG